MTAGDIYTVAGNGQMGFSGDGGPATSAEFNGPLGVAADTAGNLAIADLRNNRVRLVAARTGTFYGQAMTAGDIYTVAGNGHKGVLKGRGPGRQRRARLPVRRGGRHHGRPGDRGLGQRPGPAGDGLTRPGFMDRGPQARCRRAPVP
jgi:hypothetical protein